VDGHVGLLSDTLFGEVVEPILRAESEAIRREYGDNRAFAHIIADVKARLGI
jgi:hypothetical protein